MECKVNIYFSMSHGLWPLRHEVFYPDGGFCNSIEVQSWASFPVDGEIAYVPTAIVYEQGYRDEATPAKREVYLVDPSSLKVNHAVDDDVFTISPTRAEVVRDLDADAAKNPPPPHREEEAKSPLVLLGSLGFVVIAIGAVALAWFLRRPSP